jgi:hypothetical protein
MSVSEMDAYLAIARESALEAIHLARRGDVPAILSLAFNPLIHLLVGMAGRTPEELLDQILAEFERPATTTVLITGDEALVAELVRCTPGPVFDLRSGEEYSGDGPLAQSLWWVPLQRPGAVQIGMVERVLRLVDRAYVLDSEPRLRDSGAEVAVPGGVVTWIRHRDCSLREFTLDLLAADSLGLATSQMQA